MADMAASNAVATKCTDMLIDKVMKELPYLCCYKSYAAGFEEEKEKLKAAVGGVNMKIKEAQKRNETQIDPTVEQWVQKANKRIQQETTPKKWFPRYSLAKKLESMTKEIQTMMDEARNFSQVAHAAERPGMEFYSQEFMYFKGRNSVLEKLKEDLKDGNKCRIGLHAMGGSGKTTMAKEVGKRLENSKPFDKVIFIEVPDPVDEKKIREDIEKKLDLKMDDEKKTNSTRHAEEIWIGIKNAGKVLVILDDVWKEFDLENIGIQHGIHTEGRCCALLTTRDETVCTRMGCQKIIKLEILPKEDAVNLFLHHASESGKECPNKSKLVASKIVNECGRLPVIVVAVAKTFRNWDPNEWEEALVATEKDSSLRHGNTVEVAKKIYNSLKRSFDCLDTRAHELIFLCSIFPRAYEIPVELLSRIAIGLGLGGNVDSYYKARSQVLSIKRKLVSSTLLLPAEKGFVKMHDVIRDVAQQIEDEKIQVIMDSKTKLEENAKYSFWMIDDFPNYFEGNNLEVLLVWVNANAYLEVPDAIFRDLQEFRIYHIEGSSSKRSFQLDALAKRYFNSTKLNGFLSESTVKSLAARAEILELTECNERRWTNMIPDMVHAKKIEE
ncbi:hypothetical protein K1719_046675 [Acacia pycnantha]|nr:hypothetical protein K1719_046675 [Acacia pycnantha]